MGRSVEFDGVDDYVEIPDKSILDMDIQNGKEITMEAWIYPLDVTGEVGIIAKRQNYRMMIRPGGKLKFQTFGWTSSSFNIPINKWSHVAISYDGTSKDLNFYINGYREFHPNYTVNGSINNNNLRMGRGYDGGYYFDGKIDNVRIYKEALSASEIQKHYAEGAERHGIAIK